MAPELAQFTKSQQPSNQHAQFRTPSAVHQPPCIRHEMMQERLIDRRLLRHAGMLQTRVLYFWTFVDNWIQEMMSLVALQGLLVAKHAQNEL